MPADYFWNPVDFDSDESISNTVPRNYVDPWDLENYAYIREHLESVELESERSSYGEPLEASSSSFYYAPAPAKSKEYSPPTKQKFDSLYSDYSSGKYAAIEDIYGVSPRRNSKQPRQTAKQPQMEELYGIANFDLESDMDDSYISNSKSTALYETTRRQPPVTVKRRMSYSYGDYGYNSYQSIYSKLDDHRRSVSERPNPIYDDVRGSRFKPNIGLNNYGHLQIDYSFSWNNLDKYIYN